MTPNNMMKVGKDNKGAISVQNFGSINKLLSDV
jgi:hypothetical protein